MSGGKQTEGWVLYDAACGFCAWWIPFWAGTLGRAGFDTAPLQSEWALKRLGLSEEEVTDDLRLLLVDGSHLAGADVYLHVMRRIWWARPLAVLFSLPGLNRLFWQGYRWFNRNRFLVSRACRLPPARDSHNS